ncbi:hypothetical protein GCM10010256_68620 [Streptomyces coeruleorubidus]|nr:hypothetical protein GCM10010256_68620 [Streptomyces coeruleorubidus]
MLTVALTERPSDGKAPSVDQIPPGAVCRSMCRLPAPQAGTDLHGHRPDPSSQTARTAADAQNDVIERLVHKTQSV